MDQLYTKHQKIIKGIARNISRSTGMEFDELEAEGNLIFVQCCKKFDGRKGPFDKYLSTALHFCLYRYARRNLNNDIEIDNYNGILDATIHNFSTDAEYIANLVYFPCDELLNQGKRTNYGVKIVTKTSLYNYLHDVKSWKRQRINQAFTEIQSTIMGAQHEKRIKNLNEYDKELLESVRGKKIACNIVSVSRSGMTRRMRFYACVDDDMKEITYLIGAIAGYSQDKNHDLIVGGCGMDMIFSVLSNFNYAMAKYDTGKSIQELLKSKECGEHIYDKYFINANDYRTL